ncbi:MAG: GAF domain-containing protein, partial [Chloroflexi bacterium]|nr:GAF domain-containing protein [Chloroflexota bacterium]
MAVSSRDLAVVSAIGEAASRSLDLAEVLQAALATMVDLMDLPAGGIWLVEGERLVLKTHYGLSADFLTEESIMPLSHCLCGRCARVGKALAIDNLADESSLADSACAREGFQSIASVPLRAKGYVLGVMQVASRQEGAFSPGDQQILTAVGDRVATAIENAWLYEETRRRAAHLKTASLIGRRITALSDLNSLLSEVTRMIREEFGYYHAHIFLVDEDAGDVVLKWASGPNCELIMARGLRLKIGQEGICGWVAHTGQALLCNDVSREPRYHAEELTPETRAELAVPLRVGKRVIGVLDVQSDRCDAFDEQDVAVLHIVGNQVGIAIENAKLFQETSGRYQAMVALHETSLDMISELDVAELLEALLRRGVHLLGAQAGSLFLYDAAEATIYNAASYNTWRDWADVTLRPGEGVIGQVILTGEPLIVNDYENWESRAEAFAGAPHTVVMGAPLKWQDQIIGGIVILNEPSAQPFDGDDLWLLSLFADSATCAIKNAELHTRVKEFSQELERRVEERTGELWVANEEIAAKASQLRSLLAKTIRIQEEERGRIARDMHDSVIQLIAAARYELQAA